MFRLFGQSKRQANGLLILLERLSAARSQQRVPLAHLQSAVHSAQANLGLNYGFTPHLQQSPIVLVLLDRLIERGLVVERRSGVVGIRRYSYELPDTGRRQAQEAWKRLPQRHRDAINTAIPLRSPAGASDGSD